MKGPNYPDRSRTYRTPDATRYMEWRKIVHAHESGVMTMAEAARILGVSQQAIRRMIDNHRLPAVTFNGDYRYFPLTAAVLRLFEEMFDPAEMTLDIRRSPQVR